MEYEKKKLFEDCGKVLDHKEQKFREEKLPLEQQIKIRDEGLLIVEKEMGELTRKKNNLENEVNLRSNVIRKREKEIEEKKQEVYKAIEESNRLRHQIDAFQQHGNAMVEDKDMSKKIEILEDELAEKEHAISDLRKNNTMTRKEVEEELGKITKCQEKKLEDMNEKIDLLTNTLMRVLANKKWKQFKNTIS